MNKPVEFLFIGFFLGAILIEIKNAWLEHKKLCDDADKEREALIMVTMPSNKTEVEYVPNPNTEPQEKPYAGPTEDV